MKNHILFLLAFLIPFFVFSQKKFKTHSVSIFKNGITFLDKSKTLDARNGKVILDELPFSNNLGQQRNILFGTIWMVAKNNSIPFAKFSKKKLKETKEIENLAAVFQQNIGKKIKVNQTTSNDGLEGKLKMYDSNTLVIQQGKKWIRIPISDLKDFEFLEDYKTTYDFTSTKKVLELDFAKKSKAQDFRLMYLQKGMVWSPNYFLQILGNQKAKLSLKANVMNDLEDLENVEINFVEGIPAFKYENVQDPFTSNFDFQTFITSLNSSKYQSSNSYAIQYDPETYEEKIIMVPNKTETIGTTNEDLFFYKKKNVTLEKGGRAMFDILETEIEYKDIYASQLQPSLQNPTSYNNNNNKDLPKNTVWHSLVFENKTDFPFTSGSVFFLKKGKGQTNMPISQNQIYYTPPTGEAKVKMAIASDILVLDADKELKRDMNVRNNRDDLITIEGSIDITNYRDKAVQMEIARLITGELLKSDLEWITTGLTTQLNSMNPKFKVKWEFELKPKETKKIVYTYQVYVR